MNALKRIGTMAGLAAGWSLAAAAHGPVFVTPSGSFNATGAVTEPFDTVRAGLCRAPSGTDVRVTAGMYRETGRFADAGRLIASGGTVRLGRTAPVTVNFRVVSYTAHLVGLEIQGLINAVMSLADSLPVGGDELADWINGQITDTEWQDPARTAWFGRLLPGTGADVIGVQEFWDERLLPGFLANYGPTFAMYPDQRILENYDVLGFDVQIPVALNSGMLLFSPTPLDHRAETAFGAETGFEESLATKCFQQATLNKGGVSIGIFHTHTQADITAEATQARTLQLMQMGIAIQNYRAQHPSNPVIVIGDLNVIAGSTEYINGLKRMLGSGAPYPFPNSSYNAPVLKDAGMSLACAAEGTACTSCASNELRDYFNPTDNVSKRLDYALYQDSLDGTTRIIPTAYERLEFEVPANSPPLVQDGYITRVLSDHYGIQVDFQVTR